VGYRGRALRVLLLGNSRERVHAEMELGMLFLRGIVGWLLVTAGIEKLWRRDSERGDGEPLPLTERFPRWLVRGVAIAEVGAGLALFAPVIWPAGAIAAAVLLGAFTAVVGLEARRGQRGDCGCGGLLPAGKVSDRHAALTGAGAALSCAVASAGIIHPTSGIFPGLAV